MKRIIAILIISVVFGYTQRDLNPLIPENASNVGFNYIT